MHLKGRKFVIDLKAELRVTVSGSLAFGGSGLDMLVTLITDNMRAVDSVEVLGANNADVEHTHGTLDEVAVDALGLLKLLAGLLQSRVVSHNALLNLLLSLNQLVLSRNVLGGKLGDFDASIGVLVQLLKQLIDDLGAVLVIDALVHQVVVHLVTVNHAVSIGVDHSELLCKFINLTLTLSLKLTVIASTAIASTSALFLHHGHTLS